MKKIILILILVITVFIIYYFNVDKKTKYLYIGNSSYNKYNNMIYEHYNKKTYMEYIRDDDYRVVDLIRDIKDNKDINNRKFQNALIKSNIIVINIGLYDIEYKKELNYDYVDALISDIEGLVKLIKKYNKDRIYFLGFNNKNEYYKYVNNKLEYICKLNKVIYIDIEKPIYKQLY